jgi:hypothetical protein
LEGNISLKNPVTPPGIDPRTVQLVAQRLNHYANPSPRYLGTLTNLKILVSDEIKSRIAAGNRCVYRLRQIFRSTEMSKAVKIKINKMMVHHL